VKKQIALAAYRISDTIKEKFNEPMKLLKTEDIASILKKK
jgi:hypothetical protein